MARTKNNKKTYDVEVFKDGQWVLIKRFDDWFLSYGEAFWLFRQTKLSTRITINGKPGITSFGEAAVNVRKGLPRAF
ncbi:MAG TPA: hypothetical protein PK684_08970 [Bacillota bacterium]|nr:hypothetical protein [Bacillota bacterium]